MGLANENGLNLLNLASTNRLQILNTFFAHDTEHLWPHGGAGVGVPTACWTLLFVGKPVLVLFVTFAPSLEQSVTQTTPW